MPRVSVIVPNWNGAHFLPTCFDSLQEQSLTDFEVVLVDNGSTDGSVELVRDSYPTVRLLTLGENRGFSAAVNAGIRATTGTYIALLNNDTRVHPDWLSSLCTALDRHPELGFCASKILFFDPLHVINSVGDSYAPWRSPRNIGLGQVDNGQYEVPRKVFGACAAASIYRRSMLNEIGLFDEDFWAYYEDVDLSFRAQLYGYQCLYVPKAVVHHVGSGTAGYLSPRVVYFLRRNLLFLIAKNMPSKLMLKYLIPMTGLQVGLDIAYTLRGYTKSVIRARLDALRGLPKMWRCKRRKIQRGRRVSDAYLESLFKAYER